MMQAPEFVLSEPEAERISSAIRRVEEYYGGSILPEEVAIWVNLGTALGGAYLPRFVAFRVRKRKEAQRPPLSIVQAQEAAPDKLN